MVLGISFSQRVPFLLISTLHLPLSSVHTPTATYLWLLSWLYLMCCCLTCEYDFYPPTPASILYWGKGVFIQWILVRWVISKPTMNSQYTYWINFPFPPSVSTNSFSHEFSRHLCSKSASIFSIHIFPWLGCWSINYCYWTISKVKVKAECWGLSIWVCYHV